MLYRLKIAEQQTDKLHWQHVDWIVVATTLMTTKQFLMRNDCVFLSCFHVICVHFSSFRRLKLIAFWQTLLFVCFQIIDGKLICRQQINNEYIWIEQSSFDKKNNDIRLKILKFSGKKIEARKFRYLFKKIPNATILMIVNQQNIIRCGIKLTNEKRSTLILHSVNLLRSE